MAHSTPHTKDVLEHLRQAGKPLHAGALAKRCGVAAPDFGSFLAALDRLVEQGKLVRAGGKRYELVRTRRAEQWTGSLSVNPRGFGFVTAAGKPDVFVRGRQLAGALHGDLIVVAIEREERQGLEGRVVEVVQRRSPTVAGILRRKRKSAWLEPDDDRIRGPIVIADPESGKDGDAAVVEILRFPTTSDENPEGRLKAVLGKAGEPEVEVAKIKAREGIEEQHPPEAMREAEDLATRTRQLKLEHRKDLRHLPFLTIDPEDARDHDDAVYAEQIEGGFRVYVAIADVAEYVQAGTALDQEAMARGCTIYLPDRAIPMLPSSLAADLCSLLPEMERYCVCAIVDVDENGVVKRVKLVEGLMRAAAMITYSSAARALRFTEKAPTSPQAEAFKGQLKLLARVSGKLRRARMRRGALDLNLPEAKVVLDESGVKPLAISQRAEDPGIKKAYQIVEDLMLLANEAVARWMVRKKLPAIFRVHGKPDQEKLQRVVDAAEALGVSMKVDDFAEPKNVASWLKRLQKHPRGQVLESLLLRALKQAVYDVKNIGHFGLASDCYLHFTSPIRRYPDVLVHRLLKQQLRGSRTKTSDELIEQLELSATQASTRERTAVKVEREVVDLYRAIYMRDHLGEILEGRVTALVGNGMFVAVPEPFVDIMIRLDTFKEPFELADDQLSYVAPRSGRRIALGDLLTVEVDDVSLERRQVYGHCLAVPGEAAHASQPPTPERRGRRQGRGPAAEKERLRGRPAKGGERKSSSRSRRRR